MCHYVFFKFQIVKKTSIQIPFLEILADYYLHREDFLEYLIVAYGLKTPPICETHKPSNTKGLQ
jgi:hypothetical protein